MPKLIWVEGTRGPEPQFVRDDSALMDGHGKVKTTGVKIIEQIDIPSDVAHLDLNTLARMYPCGV